MSKKKRRSRDHPTNTRSTTNDALGAWLIGAAESLEVSGYTRMSDCPEVSAGVDAIAGLVGSMTIHLMQNGDGGDVRVRDGLAAKVDISPYSLGTRKSFIEWIVRTMMTSGNGNAFVLPVFDGGFLDDLVPMPGASAYPSGAWYEVQWRGRTFAPDEVMHFVLRPSLTEPWRGTGYRVQLRDVTKNLRQANATKNAFMSQKWKPSVIIRVQGVADEFSTKEGRDRLLNSYIDTDEAGKPWVVPADLLDVQQVKPLTLNDLAINNAVTLDKRTVASILHVPAFLLGVGDFNAAEYNNFIRTTVMQFAQIIQQELTKKLLIAPDRYFKLNARSLYAYDLKELEEIGSDMYAKGMMEGNEVRDWLGLSPKAGLNQLVMLENYIPADKIGDQKKLLKGGDSNA